MRSVDDLLAEGVSGRRVLLRTDLNVPLDKSTGAITDDGRIRASVPTIQKLVDGGARVVVTAHLGRPKGAPDPAYTLEPVAKRLGELLDGRDAGADPPVVGDPAVLERDVEVRPDEDPLAAEVAQVVDELHRDVGLRPGLRGWRRRG